MMDAEEERKRRIEEAEQIARLKMVAEGNYAAEFFPGQITLNKLKAELIEKKREEARRQLEELERLKKEREAEERAI